jgi:hypothetical protein
MSCTDKDIDGSYYYAKVYALNSAGTRQTDNLMYDPGLLEFIDKALANEEKDVLYLEPGKEYDLWFFYHVLGTYSNDNTYYIQGDFQNYNDHDSYNGYLIELNNLIELD